MANASDLFLALLLQIQSLGAPAIIDEVTSHDVIVRAGASGLYAAKTLQSLGYETLVIEATDRIGGE